MMGGGFGGCTINLVHRESIKNYLSAISLAYYKEFNIELSPLLVELGDGVKVIDSLLPKKE